MKKIMNGSIGRAISLLAALALLVLLSPWALADGASDAADAIEIAEDGAVTLVSGHMAGEGVSSVQFQLRYEGEAGFDFADLGGRLTYRTVGDGVISVYISGSKPLMDAAQGQTRLLVGYVTGDIGTVEPVSGSLEYVYGKLMVPQNMVEEASDEPAEGSGAKARLQEALKSATDQFGFGPDTDTSMYTEDSWNALRNAVVQIETLLSQDEVTDADADAALQALEEAVSGLVLTTRGTLEVTLAKAKAIDGSKYTADSYGVLQTAIAEAESLLARREAAGSDEFTAAADRLQAAMDGLVELVSADGSGDIHADGPDGGSTGSPDSQSTDQTGAAAAAAGPTAPNTGDDTALLPWTAALMLCLAALTAVLRRRERG